MSVVAGRKRTRAGSGTSSTHLLAAASATASTSTNETPPDGAGVSSTVKKRKKTTPASTTNSVATAVAASKDIPPTDSTPAADTNSKASPEATNDEPVKIETKRIVVGTLHCKPTSYICVHKDGIKLYIETDAEEKAEVLLGFGAFFDYMVCEAPSVPVMIIRGNTAFGETVRTAIPSLKKTDNQDLSCHIFDPFSPDKCHWYVIIELMSAGSLCDLIAALMRYNISSSISSARLMLPKSILAEEAKKKINATQTITLQWKELQLGTWKSQHSSDRTVHISGSRIKFKAKCEMGEVTLAIHLTEVNALSICTAQTNPVLFVRASESFGWSARDRLGISSTFKHGRDYYNPDSPETRFKYVTFRLEKQGLSRDLWQQLVDMAGDRYLMVDPISARSAQEVLHKLTYQPVACESVRIGANELDEIRAVTIHFDSVCICGCMLDSVVTMNICITDIKEISICIDDKLPVLLIKTSTNISDTLKMNMGRRSSDVFFDPNSKDLRTQYIVLELNSTANKPVLKKILTTLQSVLTHFNDRNNSRDDRATSVKVLSKKKTQDMLSEIKKTLPQKECTCCKQEDKKWKEEVKSYVQSMTQKHGCDVLEKIAGRALELEKKILCSVCLDKDCQIVFSCGHMICERCDLSLRKCHICRTKILRKVKIFI